MPLLRTLPWWPTEWFRDGGRTFIGQEVRKSGIVKTVRPLFGNVLIIVVECKGELCTSTITAPFSDDILILLRHILFQHYGERIENVENLNIDFEGI